MRTALIAWLFVAPITAFAQTPADIARQLWPMGPPISSSAAPSQPPRETGSFGPSDLARQLWPYGAPTADTMRTPQTVADAGGFTVLDLARSRNAPATEQLDSEAKFLIAGANVPH